MCPHSWHVTTRPHAVGDKPSGKRARCASAQSERVRWRARARATRSSAGCAGGRSWRVAPWSHTEEERPLAGAVAFHTLRTIHKPLGTARARGKLECCASFSETASAVAWPRVHTTADCALEAAAGTSNHGLVAKERGLSPAQCPSKGDGVTPPPAARRAHAASARAAPPPHRERAQRRARVCATRNPAAQSEGLGWHVAPQSRTEAERPLTSAVAFYSLMIARNLRGTGRARGKRACCASSQR